MGRAGSLGSRVASDPAAVSVTGEWRYFRMYEVREAKLWAAMGGVAVHDNEGAFPFRRWRRTAHLLAPDVEALIAAGVAIGMTRTQAQAWLQRGSTLHLDIFGSPLRRAIAKCVDAPADWPALPE